MWQRSEPLTVAPELWVPTPAAVSGWSVMGRRVWSPLEYFLSHFSPPPLPSTGQENDQFNLNELDLQQDETLLR